METLKRIKEKWAGIVEKIRKIKALDIKRFPMIFFDKVLINPIRTAWLAFIVATITVVFLTILFRLYDLGFIEDVLVEAHGMLLDLLVIGIFILWLNKLGEKQITIQRYQEEIDDYRGWQSDEAAHRIGGNIRRLNRNKISKIDLSNCFLEAIDLTEVNLQGAQLFKATLRKANLRDANLQGANLKLTDLREVNLRYAKLDRADFAGANMENALLKSANLKQAYLGNSRLYPDQTNLKGVELELANLQEANFGSPYLEGPFSGAGVNLELANLKGADLYKADFRGANLLKADLGPSSDIVNLPAVFQGRKISGANLQEANLQEANLQEANLEEANLQGANLRGANLRGANLQGANLQDTCFSHANLRGTKNLTIDQISKVNKLYMAELDSTLSEQIKISCPHLLD